MLEHLKQRAVEAAAGVALRGGEKLVVESERVEESPEPRVVVLAEARIFTERVGHLRQRLAEMLGHHLLVGDVVGHFAQAVHVVGKADEPGRDLVFGQDAEGMAHHSRAADLGERADMRQPRGSVTGLEDDGTGPRRALDPAQDFARLLERPRLALAGGRHRRGVGVFCGGPVHGSVERVVGCRATVYPTNFTIFQPAPPFPCRLRDLPTLAQLPTVAPRRAQRTWRRTPWRSR